MTNHELSAEAIGHVRVALDALRALVATQPPPAPPSLDNGTRPQTQLERMIAELEAELPGPPEPGQRAVGTSGYTGRAFGLAGQLTLVLCLVGDELRVEPWSGDGTHVLSTTCPVPTDRELEAATAALDFALTRRPAGAGS
jgi:hypothetical protein